ncbi:hypothetical protein [Pseudomonas shirazica]|uniref:hypothetical protein n=1 Tax=Pseudomonas shirazica TaxID=1940636 RepID=UPI003AAAE660
MNFDLIGRLYAFAVTLADHYDAPPSHLKTAQHYQLAERARQLRAEVLSEGFTDLTATRDAGAKTGGVADASASSALTCRLPEYHLAGLGQPIATHQESSVALVPGTV